MNLDEVKEQIVSACHKMWARGLVANHDGNISVKLDSGRFLVTPTSFSKAEVMACDLLVVDHSGKVLDGKHKLFSEFAWHLAIYRARPDVFCVVHGHPAVAGGYPLAGEEIGGPQIPEAIVSLGRGIFNLSFFSPLDVNLTAANEKFERDLSRVLNGCDSFLAPGNGAWTVGQSVEQTYLRLELVEQIARAHHAARTLSGTRGLSPLLSRDLVEALLKKRPSPSMLTGGVMTSSQSPPQTSDTDLIKDQIRKLVQTELEKVLKA